MMMETARTSETLVNFYQTTWRYNPEDSHLHTQRRENLKYYLKQIYSAVTGCEIRRKAVLSTIFVLKIYTDSKA
jgi:serine acetyltransferase